MEYNFNHTTYRFATRPRSIKDSAMMRFFLMKHVQDSLTMEKLLTFLNEEHFQNTKYLKFQADDLSGKVTIKELTLRPTQLTPELPFDSMLIRLTPYYVTRMKSVIMSILREYNTRAEEFLNGGGRIIEKNGEIKAVFLSEGDNNKILKIPYRNSTSKLSFYNLVVKILERAVDRPYSAFTYTILDGSILANWKGQNILLDPLAVLRKLRERVSPMPEGEDKEKLLEGMIKVYEKLQRRNTVNTPVP